MTRAASLLALLLALPATAGEFNKVVSVGDPAPAWRGLIGTDGKPHALADLAESPVVVVVFTCNSCPVAVGYEDRVTALARANPKAAFVAINSNAVPEDALPEMVKRAEKRKFPFAYLSDPDSAVAKRYGATMTPEFFVLNKNRKIVYAGALDDKSPPAEATAHFVADAIAAALKGATTPPVAETRPRGCRIRFARPERGN